MNLERLFAFLLDVYWLTYLISTFMRMNWSAEKLFNEITRFNCVRLRAKYAYLRGLSKKLSFLLGQSVNCCKFVIAGII